MITVTKISENKIEISDGIYPYVIYSNYSLNKYNEGVSILTNKKRNFVGAFDYKDVDYFDIDGVIIEINSVDDLYNAFKLCIGDHVDLYSLFNYKVLKEGGEVKSLDCIINYAY